MAQTASFRTTISGFGNNAGIEVPPEALAELGAGQRPAVIVNVDGYEYRNTVGVMGGRHLISVNAAVRKESGLAAGDEVTVTLTIADAPREVEVPDDFARAMGDAGVRAFFDSLPNSLQRLHADSVAEAKTPETRERRIAKAVALFKEGKRR
jgi:hypothetical protein